MLVAAAVLAELVLGKCQIPGQRQADLPHIFVFEDGIERNRTRGVEAPEAMPSTGNLYTHVFNKDHDTDLICYSGSPIGTFYETQCCSSGTGCTFVTPDRPVFNTFSEFTSFVNSEKNLSSKVFTTAVECDGSTADGRMTRTAAERSSKFPEAAPYEFVARNDESACDCQGAVPEFHSENYDITSKYAHQWASTLRDIPGGPNIVPAIEQFSACNFFESGYGWSNDQVSGKMVPVIPKRDLSPQQRFRVNASGYRIPVFDDRPVPSLPCDGNPNLEEDVNYCFFGDQLLERRIVRPEDATELSAYCESNEIGPGKTKANRCCMKLEIEQKNGNTVSLHAIRADVLMAAGCASVHRAPNNGDGQFHYKADFKKLVDDIYEKSGAGHREGQLQRDLFIDPSLRRLNVDTDGFHQTCIPYPDKDRPQPTCSRFRPTDVGADGFIADADLSNLEQLRFAINTGSGPGADHNARITAIKNEDQETFVKESRLFFRSCLVPTVDSFGNNIQTKTKVCESVGLYSAQPFNFEEETSCEELPIMVEAWAKKNGVPLKDAMSEWSKMPPSVYASSGSLPLPPADSFTSPSSRCFPKADARTWPKDRTVISKMDDIGTDYRCKTDCCLGGPDPDDNGCQDKCSYLMPVLEQIQKYDGGTVTADDWQKIMVNCETKDKQSKNFCKLAGQLYVDRLVYKRDTETLPAYDRGTKETPYCVSRTDGSIVTDDKNIFFIGAGPRTRGIEHPMWEGGGYIGGSFSDPSYILENTSSSYAHMNLSYQRANSQVQLVAPDGELAIKASASSSLGNEPVIESILGAIVADPSCLIENHRASRMNEYISIPGLYPRYLDLTTKSMTECAADTTPTKNGVGLWTPSQTSFQDLYLRGGGRAGTIDDDYGDGDYYQKIDGKFYAKRSDVGTCVAGDSNGCAGYCNPAAEAGAIAGSVIETAIGVVLAAVVTVLTDGVGDAAIAAGEAAEVGGEAAAGAAEAAGEAAADASTDFTNPAFDPEGGLDGEGPQASEEFGDFTDGAEEDVPGDSDEVSDDEKQSVGEKAMDAAKQGVTKGARIVKGIGKSALKQLRASPLSTIVGVVLISGGIGTISSGTYPPSSDTAGGVKAERHWRNLLHAVVKSDVHPISRDKSTSPLATYANFPSMIMTCIDGEENCFRDVPKPSGSVFNNSDIAEDKWNYMPGMLPAQPLATHIGCHTVFENDFGNFKEELSDFRALAFKTVLNQSKTDYPRVTFQTIPASAVTKFTKGALYHAGNSTHTFKPIVDEKYLGCGMCSLYSGYLKHTATVNTCSMNMADGSSRKMRYNIAATSVFDYFATLQMENVTKWEDVTKVTMTFRSGGEQTRVWKGDDSTPGAIDVQRFLGINLTSYGSRLDKPGCLGDTSSLTSACDFDIGLRVKPTQDIECVDNTSTFTGACINPIWANDLKIITPSNRKFDRGAELVSYCANIFSLNNDGNLFSERYYDTLFTGDRAYEPLYNKDSQQFVQCANDRLSLSERIKFCQGSATALSGSSAVLGMRAAGRTDIGQVCNFASRQCLLFADDPGGWTFGKVVDALSKRQVEEPYTLLYVPVSFNVVVNIPIFGTSVATTFYNSPEEAKADAFTEAAAREPVFEDINVTWSASETLVQGTCVPGGPRVSKQAAYFGMLWAIVEGMSSDGQKYSIISFDGLAQNKMDQRTVYTRDQVYPTVNEVAITTGLQRFVIRSAFDAEAGKFAALYRPHLEPRFSEPIDIVFSGDPPKGAPTCVRFLTETELVLSGVEFQQDSPGCLALPIGSRAPVVATGQSVGGTLFHYTKCRGCPAHGLVAKGFDTSVYTNRVSQNLDVGGVAMVGLTLRLEWPEDGECDDKAMACSKLDSFSGISLALARTEGDAEVVGCPAAATSGRCYAETEREPTFILYANEKGKPMHSWYTNTRPSTCNDAFNSSDSHKGESVFCFQGYKWHIDNTNQKWAGQTLFNNDSASVNYPMVNRSRVTNDFYCTKLKNFTKPSVTSGVESIGEYPVLLTVDDMYAMYNETEKERCINANSTHSCCEDGGDCYEFVTNSTTLCPENSTLCHDKNATLHNLVPPWFGFQGRTEAIQSENTVENVSVPGGTITEDGGYNLLVDHSMLESSERVLRRGDKVFLNETSYFVYAYIFPSGPNLPGNLILSKTSNLAQPAVFFEADFPNGTVITGARTESQEPCAPDNMVVFNDGTIFMGDDAVAEAANYSLTAALTHKCSAVGCLGGVDHSGRFPRCASALQMNYHSDNGRYFFWHGIMADLSMGIFGLRQDGVPGKVALNWTVYGGGAVSGTSTRMLEKMGTGMCAQRADEKISYETCDEFVPEQQWLLVADGPFFRVEVPGDPYTCIFKTGQQGDTGPIMMPCPPCAVGSGSFVVGLPDANPTVPKIKYTASTTDAVGLMVIPLSLTDPTMFLLVNSTTGKCQCHDTFSTTNFMCPCNLKKITKKEIVRAAMDDTTVCKHAIGPLLAACDKFGGGLAAVDGYKANMVLACRALEQNTSRRFAGAAEGRGAMFMCDSNRNMLHVVDPGDYFVDGEEIVGLGVGGITAVVSKVFIQPYETGIPSVVTAPYSLEVNVSDLLTPFGGALHNLAVQSFSTEASIWAGVIVELSIIGAVVLLQVCLLSKSTEKMQTAMTNAQIRLSKKNR